MELVFQFNQHDLNKLNFPIIVENWDRIATNQAGGRQRRAYLSKFDKKEREILQRYYRIFYRWYLVTGTPQRFIFRKQKTILLIQKAVNFFATH